MTDKTLQATSSVGATETRVDPSSAGLSNNAPQSMYKRRVEAAVAEVERLRDALDNLHRPRPLAEWHEDLGVCLWWRIPVCEPPYCGDPISSDWPFGNNATLLVWTPLPDGNRSPGISG